MCVGVRACMCTCVHVSLHMCVCTCVCACVLACVFACASPIPRVEKVAVASYHKSGFIPNVSCRLFNGHDFQHLQRVYLAYIKLKVCLRNVDKSKIKVIT